MILFAPGRGWNAQIQDRQWKLVEDFENSPAWKLSCRTLAGSVSAVRIIDLDPPPLPGNRKYLSFTYSGHSGSGCAIEPPTELELDVFADMISVWVYGSDRPDRLFLSLSDAGHSRHRIFAADLSYSGWRKMEVLIPPIVRQRNTTIFQKGKLSLLGFYLQPGDSRPLRLFLDRIELRHRPLYILPERDFSFQNRDERIRNFSGSLFAWRRTLLRRLDSRLWPAAAP